MGILYFLLAVGPLIFLHELGHFLVARHFDVRCERFAIGFGPPLLTWRQGETEFSLRAFPLGGYVQMLGHFEQERREEDEGRSLLDKTPLQRVLISLAGPVMNLLLAIPLLFVVGFSADTLTAPVAGFVLAGSAADDAGVIEGDEFLSVAGVRTHYFEDVARTVRSRPGEALPAVLSRNGEEIHLTLTPEASTESHGILGMGTTEVGRIGVSPAPTPASIAVEPGTAAWNAGLRDFDRIVRVNQQEVVTWADLSQSLQSQGSLNLLVARSEFSEGPSGAYVLETPVELSLESTSTDLLSLTPARTLIAHVEPSSPAALAGLQRGDRLLTANNEPVSDVSFLVQKISFDADVPWAITYMRDGLENQTTLVPERRTVLNELNAETEVVAVGMHGDLSVFIPPETRPLSFGRRLWRGLRDGFVKTGELIAALFLSVVFLVSGQMDSSNLGGPILIADVASRAGNAGLVPYLRMCAVVSVNLGVLNLVPVPGLDGGHIAIATVEGIQKRPLSVRARQMVSYAGIVCLGLLMLFVFKNDVERYWDDIANWMNS